MIATLSIPIDGWEIRIKDNGTTGRNKINPNRLNYLKDDRECKVVGCTGRLARINIPSGLCASHKKHQNDLYLELIDSTGTVVSVPRHNDIVDYLMVWASSRNFSLKDIFAELSFNILGNVPDVSTLDAKTIHTGLSIPDLVDIWNAILPTIHKYFSITNTSSFQKLSTSQGDISVIVLVYTFVGLLICEEANRGDRWFCRNVIGDESKTTQYGGAMPFIYYAKKSFPWGVEMPKKILSI